MELTINWFAVVLGLIIGEFLAAMMIIRSHTNSQCIRFLIVVGVFAAIVIPFAVTKSIEWLASVVIGFIIHLFVLSLMAVKSIVREGDYVE